MRLLLVEDDHILGAAVRDHLVSIGHGVDWARRLDDANLSLQTVTYELVLLDLNLPDGHGLGLLRSLRANDNPVPVIIITAQDQIAVRIEGLESGADDYLVKPFDLAELGARLSAVARRYAGIANPQITIGDAVVDLGRKIALVSGKTKELTAREWTVLDRLLRHRGTIVSKPDIEDALYAFGSEIESNAVEVYVSRLRKKLGRDSIITSRGLGYKIGAV